MEVEMCMREVVNLVGDVAQSGLIRGVVELGGSRGRRKMSRLQKN